MTPDSRQQEIVTLKDSRSLVLGGPGCGKTFLLARRLVHAHATAGISFDEMICLTFTNRAAREMNVRIESTLGYRPKGLFVGNLHRFCSRFLHENKLLDADSSLLDEEDRDAWLNDALGLKHRSERKQLTDLAMLLYQQDHNFPRGLWRKLDFSPDQSLINAAMAYREYKETHRLFDFDDLLLRTYKALDSSAPHSLRFTSYKWVQVDEVQDLTPLQLAIIDSITSETDATVMYLGDEQQAIFEFIGAGGPALDKLKQRCANSTYRLNRNYRSAPELVRLCNQLAQSIPGVASCEPSIANNPRNIQPELMPSTDFNLALAVAAKVRMWRDEAPDERIAVLCRTNDQAEQASTVMTTNGIDNTLVARNDLFRRMSYKTIYSHLSAIAGTAQSDDWARLLFRTKAVKTLTEARSLVGRLKESNISPIALLDKPEIDCEPLQSSLVKKISDKFKETYGPLFHHSRELLGNDDQTVSYGLGDEMDYTYRYLTERGMIEEITRWDAVTSFMKRALSDERGFRAQLFAHIAELRTFNESDLLENEPLTVVTIHKAKGLEFDRVIVYNASEHSGGRGTDDARVNYVAFSRAKQRLAVCYTGRLSQVVGSAINHFKIISPDEVEAMALLERLHTRRPINKYGAGPKSGSIR